MSASPNLDLVRSIYATWERGDFSSAEWVEEYRELDGERVLVLTRRRARGQTSRVQVWSQGANLIRVRGGKVIRIVHYYWDRERAFADLGLKGVEVVARER